MTGRRGISLLIVVALLGALAMTAGMAALSARISTSAALSGLERLRLDAAIDSAAARTAASLSREDGRWIADGRLYEMRIDDIVLRIRPLAEPGRFDLNRGTAETLTALLQAQDVPALSARRIAGAAIDWRDADDDVGNDGAESAAYRANGVAPPPNRPFLAVAEFRSVLGVDEAIYAAVSPYLTVHGRETVAARYAPPGLVEAAGASRGEARRILASRRANRALPPADDEAAFDPAQPAVYALFIEAEASSGAQAAREIIVSLPGSESLYETLSRHSHVMGYADFLDPEPEN